MKKFIKQYKHAFPIIAFLILYLLSFMVVEKMNVNEYHLIHCRLDDYIPFCEIFVIPYFCWFAYVAGFVCFFIFFDKENYWQLFWFLVTGMTFFIVFSAIYPNGQELRPDVFPRDNIFTRMIGGLYQTDTATNILPSIHVYNSIGIQIAVMKSDKLKKHRWVQIASFILCVLIILSTMFIKQHSAIDVISAIALAVVTYVIFYVLLRKKFAADQSHAAF